MFHLLLRISLPSFDRCFPVIYNSHLSVAKPSLKWTINSTLFFYHVIDRHLTLTHFSPTGVTRQVGDALQLERSQRAGRVVSIGIAPWGIVEGANELIGRGRDVPYHAIASPR